MSIEDVKEFRITHRICGQPITIRDVALDPKEPDNLTLVPFCGVCNRRLRIEELNKPGPYCVVL